jgi:hypothetical protein
MSYVESSWEHKICHAVIDLWMSGICSLDSAIVLEEWATSPAEL